MMSRTRGPLSAAEHRGYLLPLRRDDETDRNKKCANQGSSFSDSDLKPGTDEKEMRTWDGPKEYSGLGHLLFNNEPE